MVTPERDGRAIFKILKGVVSDGVGPRLGSLSLPKRRPIDTPNFIGLTARGAVPHLTPDNVSRKTDLGGVYVALEDFMELTKNKTVPSMVEMKSESIKEPPLHAYTAMPSHMLTILGARRHPAINSPLGNSKDSISIFTSTGFRNLTNGVYRQYVDAVRPDVVIPLADMTYAEGTGTGTGADSPNSKRRTKPASSKRQLRMVERTEEWMAEFFERRAGADTATTPPHVFAPVLPLSYPAQWDYIKQLEEDFPDKLSGLAIYDADIIPDLCNHAALESLPRLSLDSNAVNPQEILRQIQLGADIFAIPFLNTISDAGVALSFTFPAPESTGGAGGGVRPLGIDMWAPEHEVAVAPLVDGCACYACARHHRAYLHHLLNAREMLGWTLLQIHNIHVLDAFFAGVRNALLSNSNSNSTSSSNSESDFDRLCADFNHVYDAQLPAGTGARPRARGYHFKSKGNDPKINSPAWEKFGNDNGDAGEGGGDVVDKAALEGDRAGLMVTGPAAPGGHETPLVPGPDAELDKMGFAEVVAEK
ncbi:tRNA-guanine transglycosylase [Xylariaceae sp. FL0594]|nr:tRNA-guanine transglycosylase [Xylariaceae sp. FL0594]